MLPTAADLWYKSIEFHEKTYEKSCEKANEYQISTVKARHMHDFVHLVVMVVACNLLQSIERPHR